MNKDLLIERVIEQIRKDIEEGDVTALDELLRFVPDQYLAGFLPEYPEVV